MWLKRARYRVFFSLKINLVLKGEITDMFK